MSAGPLTVRLQLHLRHVLPSQNLHEGEEAAATEFWKSLIWKHFIVSGIVLISLRNEANLTFSPLKLRRCNWGL